MTDCYNPKMSSIANHSRRLSIAVLVSMTISAGHAALGDEPLCHDLHAKQTVLDAGQESLRRSSYGSSGRNWNESRLLFHDVDTRSLTRLKTDSEPDEKAIHLATLKEIDAKFDGALKDCSFKNYGRALLEYGELHSMLEQSTITDDEKLKYLQKLFAYLNWPDIMKANGQPGLLTRVSSSLKILTERMRKSQCLTMAAKLNETADKLEKACEYTMARKLYKEALDIKEKNLGPNAPETTMQILDVARTAGEEKHYSEATALFEKAIALLKKDAARTDKSDLRNALQNYGQLLNEMKQEKKAEVIYNEARQLAKKD
ncbi:MAG: tetratricopeptide repeat protein [Cyanobacteria bacterium SZAS LIN-2]|nr:tetratricopeptide repeat protein [Cyanobacteria bacterium SZAS LIN-2]